MPIDMGALADDVVAESADLRAMLAGLDAAGWDAATPAAGWTVRDQVTHLAFFDDVAVRSAVEPEKFTAEKERMDAEGGVNPDAVAARYASMPGTEVLAWFDEARERLVTSFRPLDPGMRVPWFGPAMSAASSLTARLMETWAHAQDVADTVGATREPTDRLRHVAHIGVGAAAFSYATNEIEAPKVPVRVEIVAPSGALWTWGPEAAENRVTGPALDFCLAVTQRRHRDDTALEITGPVANEWMSIAQSFAGPPGNGRAKGQFS